MSAETIEVGAHYLHQQNPELHSSRTVAEVVGYLCANGTEVGGQPAQRIEAYLGFLAGPVHDGILTGDSGAIDWQVAHSVIAAPTETDGSKLSRRDRALQGARRNQLDSLTKWAEYLGDNTPEYPDWFRYFSFEAVKQLLVDSNGKIIRRGHRTRAPFPALNEAALLNTFLWIDAHLEGEDMLIDDAHQRHEAALQVAIRQDKFGPLYQASLERVVGMTTDTLKSITSGAWTRFEKGSDAYVFFMRQQGYGTPWCTAENYWDALRYIRGSNADIFLSNDCDGNPRVPRLAIITDGNNSVSEVRGIEGEHRQEVEGALADTLIERLHTFNNAGQYLFYVQNIKRLHNVCSKLSPTQQTLTKSDLRFLFDIDQAIETFGYVRPPAIRSARISLNPENKQQLRDILPEAVRDQFYPAYEGYANLMQQLGCKPLRHSDLKKQFGRQQRQWAEQGVYTYIATDMYKNAYSYRLVAAPNIAISLHRIRSVLRFLAPEVDALDAHTAEILNALAPQLAEGYVTENGGPVRFSLVCSDIDPDIGEARSIEEALETLDEIREYTPHINLDAPNPLDAISWLYTAQAAGLDLFSYQAEYGRYSCVSFTQPIEWQFADKKQTMRLAPYIGIGFDPETQSLGATLRFIKDAFYGRLKIS